MDNLQYWLFLSSEYQSIRSGPAGGHSVWSSASLLSGKSLSSGFVHMRRLTAFHVLILLIMFMPRSFELKTKNLLLD